MRLKWLMLLLSLMLLGSITVAPTFAHGGDNEEGEASGEVDDSEADNSEADNGIVATSLSPVLFGLIGVAIAIGASTAHPRKTTISLELVIVALALVTGIIHLVVGFGGDTLLLLNGVGYLGLAGALLFFDDKHRAFSPIIWTLAGYTVITIVGYFVLHDHLDTLGLTTKGIEAALVVSILVYGVVQPEDS